LFVNVDKCKTITFSRTCYSVEFAYMLVGTVLDWVSSINDLGVIMDKQMNFLEHVDVMVGKAFAVLEFISRMSLEFRDPYTLKSLYTSLVRPKLEYASCVWSPFITCIWTRLNVCRGGLYDMRCVVWVGRILMIYHRTSIDVLFCALTPL
jgi:hypothetical protein